MDRGAWRIPWTEEPGGIQSTGLQRVGHWSNLACTTLHRGILFISWILLNRPMVSIGPACYLFTDSFSKQWFNTYWVPCIVTALKLHERTKILPSGNSILGLEDAPLKRESINKASTHRDAVKDTRQGIGLKVTGGGGRLLSCGRSEEWAKGSTTEMKQVCSKNRMDATGWLFWLKFKRQGGE